MLEYTGHPLIDVGAATIAALAGKNHPSELSQADLDSAAEYIERNYTRPPLQGFLQGAVFPNSGYANPGIRGDRHDYVAPVLYAYRSQVPVDAEPCVCCGAPSAQKLARDYFPLLTGRGVINFYPWGDSGLPLCGKCLLCLQAYPLGAGGLMLVVHSDNDELTYEFARRFLDTNLSAILLAQSAGERKVFRTKFSYRTLLVDTLLQADQMQREEKGDERPFSVTAYLVSNNGQSPSLDIYHLPLQIIGFLKAVSGADYRAAWSEITRRAWRLSRAKNGKAAKTSKKAASRNYLYEDLFRLPDNARTFVRRYLLRVPLRGSPDDDPRGAYSLRHEVELISWELTELFLRKVMVMDKERVDLIRALGDRLAEYVKAENDRGFFEAFYSERAYPLFRNALIRANRRWIGRGNSPLITLDPYIQVFEEGTEVPGVDWRLARDLVVIRMVETLYQMGWFAGDSGVLEISEEEVSADTPSA